MEREEALKLIKGGYDHRLYQVFGLKQEEFEGRAQRGIDSALFKRWVLNEDADVRRSERELSNRDWDALKQISSQLKDRTSIAVFTAVAGSFLLEGRSPPLARGN